MVKCRFLPQFRNDVVPGAISRVFASGIANVPLNSRVLERNIQEPGEAPGTTRELQFRVLSSMSCRRSVVAQIHLIQPG